MIEVASALIRREGISTNSNLTPESPAEYSADQIRLVKMPDTGCIYYKFPNTYGSSYSIRYRADGAPDCPIVK